MGKGKEELSGRYFLSILELSYGHSNENEEEIITGVCFSSALNQMCLNKPSAGGIIYLDQERSTSPRTRRLQSHFSIPCLW